MPDPPHERLDQLMTRLLNESATPEELAELEQLLKSDEDARRRYVHHFDLHSELEQRAERGELGTSSVRSTGVGRNTAVPSEGRTTNRSTRLRAGLPIAIAAALLLVAAFVFTRPKRDHIATLVAMAGPVQLTGDGGEVLTDLHIGQTLNGGTFECSALESSATLRFDDGSTLNISGNTVVTVSDREQKVIRLREGSISADVKRQPVGQPFRVFTPTAELEVKGTRFDVLASSSRMKLAVREGVVRAKRVADGKSIDVPADHATVATVAGAESLVASQINQPSTTWVADIREDATTGKWVPIEILERVKLSEDIDAGLVAMEDAKDVYFQRLKAIDDEHKGGVFALPKPIGKKGGRRSPEGKEPTVLYLVVFDVPSRQAGPIVLVESSQLRFRGRVSKPSGMRLGFAARDPEGAGKRWAKPERIKQVDEEFDIVVPVADFMTGRNASSGEPTKTLSNGWELTHVYCMTNDPDAKLQITHVELLAGKP